MSAKYLLPCHDGNTVEVTTADAGRMIDCPCGNKVQVPTLRGVQNLPRASQSDGVASAPTWSAQQGAIFTIGLCLLVVGLIALGLLFRVFRQIDTTKPDMNQAVLAEFELAAENAEPANTLEVWHALRNNPLGDERGETYWEYQSRYCSRVPALFEHRWRHRGDRLGDGGRRSADAAKAHGAAGRW